MSAYKDALTIDADAPDQRLAMAADVLAGRKGVVMFEGILALRATQAQLLCEVVDPTPSSHRCATEYEVLVENAMRALDASKLSELLPALPRKWVVVDEHGSEPVELWHAP
jgi:hypothetical protein